MANEISTQTLNNGPRNFSSKIFIQNTGTASDESDTLLFDASVLGLPENKNLKLDRIQGQLGGFSAHLTWDGNTNSDILTIPDGNVDNDFSYAGGIINDAGSPTGDVLLSTSGVGSNEFGSFVVHFKKNENSL